MIEDVLPIAVINERAQREKIGHIVAHPRKLHLWWARRPLIAARAAVYSTLVPAEGRDAEADTRFFDQLYRWDVPSTVIDRARRDILEANGGTPPKVLDMFAGGGAIPLEAARLGCDVTAIELNPVAHLIERCMLEYPQDYPGLADDIRTWGRRWVESAREQLIGLYPPVGPVTGQQSLLGHSDPERRPLAYLWTRTVRCPNPAAPAHEVPLVRQTWLARKPGRCIALRTVPDREAWRVGYRVVEAGTPDALGFDPAAGSKRGDATCPLCGATVDSDYVKAEGVAGRLGMAPLAAVLEKASGRGRDYLPAGSYALPDDAECMRRIEELDVEPPDEQLVAGDSRWFQPTFFGLTRFRDLFTPRQLLLLGTLASGLRRVHLDMLSAAVDEDRARAVATCLALAHSRLADHHTTLCRWEVVNQTAMNAFARQALPMVWDFVESNPFGPAAGAIAEYVTNTAEIIERLPRAAPVRLIRGSATSLPLLDNSIDAVVTDPPYYDNISYADLSDFFYVWLKRSIGDLYPDDLGGDLTPKRDEAVVAPYRHNGRRDEARAAYEQRMAMSFLEANRVLRSDAPLICIYAHKTTLGWSSLIEALRIAGFAVTEAWPLDTEMPARSVGQNTASLASSVFLVARKRAETGLVGAEGDVLGQLDTIIAERLARLGEAGITGSDLVIATVGAGLRAFTRYERVEKDNGESIPAEQFLLTVQNRVLDAIFGGLVGADPATRFYVASQFSYGYAPVPFDEAKTMGYVTAVEVDGPHGLAAGHNPLVGKKGSTVWLRDFEERGSDAELGTVPMNGGRPRLIDVAHGLLWRAEYRPGEIAAFLDESRPDRELLRTVVQTLSGKALRKGSGDGKPREAAAAERLLGSWRRVVPTDSLVV